MIKKDTTLRRQTTILLTFALLAPMLLAASTALAAEAANAPLAVFRPGAPGEPSWSVLHLDVEREGLELQVRVDDSNLRCPLAWGFLLFTRGPAGIALARGLTIDFAYGHNGARVHSEGLVNLDHDTVEHDGATACETGGGGITFGFPALPVGELYLLQYKSGTPFDGYAEVRAPKGGIRIVDESHGDRVFYLGAKDFAEPSMQVEAYSPRGCGSPNLNPDDGFCKPQYRWPGGVLPGADVATERSARLMFTEQPYFFVGGGSAVIAVTNATLRDPLGLVHAIRSSTGVAAGSTAVSIGSPAYSTKGAVADHPPGEYLIDVQMNAAVGSTAVPWHAAGADFHFPTGDS